MVADMQEDVRNAKLYKAVHDLLACVRFVEAGTWHVSSDRMALLREAWADIEAGG